MPSNAIIANMAELANMTRLLGGYMAIWVGGYMGRWLLG